LKNKLPWVATVIAELLDQNNDGCRDDPNVEEAMRTSLQKFKLSNFFIKLEGETARIEEIETRTLPPKVTEAPIGGPGENGFSGTQYGKLGQIQSLDKADINPKCTKAGKFKSCKVGFECATVGYGKTDKCVDATVEEVHHFIHGKYGFAKAYPNIFGMKPTLVSTLQNLMDNARGKRIIKPAFSPTFKWPTTAWWTNTDSSCAYDCQLMEYLYWGFQSYTGLAREMKYEEYPVQSTFKWLKKDDLKKNDKALFDIFENSKKGIASYRTATRIPTGKYTGCKQCQRPKSMSWDGKYYKGKP